MHSARAPWTVASALLGALCLLTFAYPVTRAFSYLEVNFNEGWNAYRAQMAAAGAPLYGAPPKFTVTNYPPLSFHFLGLAGRITGDPTFAGRYVSLIAIGINALLIAAIVRRFASAQAAIYAALTFLLWLGVFAPSRIGMNDPQLLATVFGLAGLYFYIAKPGWLAASAAAFTISLFIKHNLLAIPAAVAIHLLMSLNGKRIAIWFGTAAAISAVLLFLTIRIDGSYFVTHMTAPRTYHARYGLSKAIDFLEMFQIAIAVAFIWTLCGCGARTRACRVETPLDAGSRNTSACFEKSLDTARTSACATVLPIAAAFALALAVAFCGGAGVDINIFFDAMILLAIILAIGLFDLSAATKHVAPILFVPILIPGILATSEALFGKPRFSALPQLEREFQDTVQFVAERSGHAFCQSPLVCFEAAKPEEICTYYTPEQIKLGRLPESDVVALIDTYYFQSIQVGVNQGEPNLGEPFTPGLSKAVRERYRVALRNSQYAVFIPNVE